MANEIVKIHNDLTNEKIGRMNAKELDLFMTICHKMKDKGTEKVVIGFDELRRLGNYTATSNKELKKDLVRANSRMLEFQLVIDIGADTVQRPLFKEFRTNAEQATVTIELWEETAYILNDIASHFTRFELEEFVNLESKYSKKLYKLLKQYRTQGTYYTSKADFYRDLGVSDTYKNNDFNKRILKPALTECKKYMPGLECVPRKCGRGGAVQGYIFTFDKELPEKPIKSKGKANKFNDFDNKQNYNLDDLESKLLSN